MIFIDMFWSTYFFHSLQVNMSFFFGEAAELSYPRAARICAICPTPLGSPHWGRHWERPGSVLCSDVVCHSLWHHHFDRLQRFKLWNPSSQSTHVNTRCKKCFECRQAAWRLHIFEPCIPKWRGKSMVLFCDKLRTQTGLGLRQSRFEILLQNQSNSCKQLVRFSSSFVIFVYHLVLSSN